jgi:hypothetical protein
VGEAGLEGLGPGHEDEEEEGVGVVSHLLSATCTEFCHGVFESGLKTLYVYNMYIRSTS